MLATLLHDGPLRGVVWLKAPADCMIEGAQVLEGGDVVVGQRCCGREPGDCRAQVVRSAANGETRWIRRLDGKTNDVFLAVDGEHRVNVVWSPEDEDCEFSTGRETLACLQRRQTSWVRLELDGACAVADPAVAGAAVSGPAR